MANKKVVNNIIFHEYCIEIEIISDKYKKSVFVDLEYGDKIGHLRMTGRDFSYVSNSKGELLHRIITKCPHGLSVDHIDGNPLNNRRENLRIVTQSINERNKHSFSRNNTGVIGVQYRENGVYKYYRVSWRDLEGKRKTKQFNINTLGKEQAFEKAVKLLKENYIENSYIIKNSFKE